MRRALFVVMALVVVSCGGPGGRAGDDEPAPDSARIMAAALDQLVTVDHTFGEGPPPFTEYLIWSSTDPGVDDPVNGPGGVSRELSDTERSAIEDAISVHGPVRWIDDPAEWRTPDLMPVVGGGVILGVGEPQVDDQTALVPVSLWCSGLCGTWLTYRVDLVDGTWAVTGIEGPVAIS